MRRATELGCVRTSSVRVSIIRHCVWGEGKDAGSYMVAVPHPSRLPSRPHVPTNLTIYQQEPLAPKMPTLLKSCARAYATTKTPKWRDLFTSGALTAHAFYRDTHWGQGRNSTRPDMPQEEWVWGAL